MHYHTNFTAPPGAGWLAFQPLEVSRIIYKQCARKHCERGEVDFPTTEVEAIRRDHSTEFGQPLLKMIEI